MADLTTGGTEIGGYRLVEQLPTPGSRVERWSARGLHGPADLFLGGSDLLRQGRGLPGWGPFPAVEWGEHGGRAWVAVPGRLVQDLDSLARRLEPGAALALGWHLVAAVAELHENGAAHGALAAAFTGLDERGRLVIRPALDGSSPAEPDATASAQASDCLALGVMLDELRVELIDDAAVRLMMNGLRRERARLRLHPGRAVRQAMAALLARHPGFEKKLVEELGPAFALSRLPTAPPPVRPRPQAAAPWERVEDEAPINAPAQVFLGLGQAVTEPQPARLSLSGAPLPPPPEDESDAAEAVDDPGTHGTEGGYETAAELVARDEDTALEPVPDSAAAEILEEGPPPEDDSGTYLAAGGAPVSIDTMPPAQPAVVEAGRDDGPGDGDELLEAGEEEPASVEGGRTLSPEEFPDPGVGGGGLEGGDTLSPEELDGGDTLSPEEFPLVAGAPSAEVEQTQDPATDATVDTDFAGLLAAEAAEASSAMVGVVPVHLAREEIPREALHLAEVAPSETREPDELEPDELEPEALDEEDPVGAAAEEAAARIAGEVAARESFAREALAREVAARAVREAAERVAAERAAAERAAAERAAAERAAAERVAAERVAAERAAAERVAAERVAAERAAERAAAERAAAERAAAERAAERAAAERAAAERAAAERAPTDAVEHLDDRRPGRLDADAPRWAGVKGVTGDSSRERELGSGKWTEEARSLDEVARELPTGPARALDLEADDSRSPVLWIALGAVALLVLAALGWRVAGSAPTQAPAAEAPDPVRPEAVVEALPEGPAVTVVTEPAGGRVHLDGRDLGLAPVVVSVPTDGDSHELCVELGGHLSCRQLTGPALASSDPYVFTVDAPPAP